MTRFLALVDQLLNFGVKNLRLRIAKDIQHTVNAIYRSDYLPFVFFAQTASGQHGIHFAREIVDGSERDGRVQIVVHPRFKVCQGSFGRRVQRVIAPRLGPGFFQSRAKVAQAGHRFLCAPQRVESKVELLAAGNTQQEIANPRRREALGNQIAKRVVVAFRLGHRLAFDFQVLEVQPVADELLTGSAFALGNFVFVMRKNQIDAAQMKVECLAQVLHRHR